MVEDLLSLKCTHFLREIFILCDVIFNFTKMSKKRGGFMKESEILAYLNEPLSDSESDSEESYFSDDEISPPKKKKKSLADNECQQVSKKCFGY